VKLIKKHGNKIALLLSFVLLATAVIGGTLAYVVTKTPSLLNTFITDHSGNLTIKKVVEHPFEDSYIIPDGIAFAFEVNLGEAYANKAVTVISAAEPNGAEVTADADGIITVSVKPGQAVCIQDIAVDTVVTVKEILSPGSGFSVKDSEGAERTVTIDKGGEELVFTNRYEPASVPVNLTVHGSKVIDGRDWIEGDSFTFVLERYEDNGEWVEVGKVTAQYTTITTTVDGIEVVSPAPDMDKFSFTQLITPGEGEHSMFTEAGTYSFRIREEAGSTAGMVYDSANYAFDVIVGDADMDGALEIQNVTSNNISVAGGNGAPFDVAATITNKYAPGGYTTAKIEIKKKVESNSGEDKSPEGFTFELYDEDNDVVATSAPTSSAGETEIVLEYDADDAGKTYNYILKEKNDGKAGWTYDAAEYPITVKVRDNYDGTISATIGETEEDEDEDQNQPSGNSVEGASIEPETTELPTVTPESTGEPTVTPESTGEPAATPENEQGTEPEIGGEDNDEGDEQGDAAEGGEAVDETITTARRSVVQGTTVRLTARRFPGVANGIVKLTAGTEGTPEPETDATATPAPEETAEPQVTPEPNGAAQIDLSAGQNAGETSYMAELTNIYTPAPATGEKLTGKKTLNGRSLNSGEFEFKLYTVDGDGDLADELLTVSNDANGEFVIDMSTIPYNKVGSYEYAVVEDKGDLGGITYDETRFKITVAVTDDNGALRAATAVTNALGATAEIEFVNEYVPAKTSFAITGEKKLQGDAYSGEAFRFSLYEAEHATFAKVGTALETVSRDGAGEFTFTAIEYDNTKVGEHYYLVEEVSGDVTGMDYDSTAYGVVVTVTDDGAGQLVATPKMVKIGSGEVEEIIFTNIYTKPAATPTPSIPVTPMPTPGITPTLPPEDVEIPIYPGDSGVPPTGDDNPVGLYAAIMLISIGAIAGLVIVGKGNGKHSHKRKKRARAR